MSSTIQIRVDDELKMKSDKLFKELGTDTTQLEIAKMHADQGKYREADEVVSLMREKYGR